MKYYENDLVTLYKGNVLDELKSMPNESVDMIVTSPPYNIGLKDRKDTNIATYDNWDDNLDYEDYCKWQIEVLNECYRVVKRGGVLFYNHKDKFKKETYTNPIEIIFKTNWKIKQNIIWDRGSAISYNAGMFGDVYENIYYCYKEVSPKTKTNHNVLSTIWRINKEMKQDHPAPFPVELPLRSIYSIFDNEKGKVIMDIFNGSGTTGVASLLLGHKYIGIDISENYLNNSIKRLENYLSEKDKLDNEILLHNVKNPYRNKTKTKQLGLEIEKKDEVKEMPKNEEVKKQDYTNLNVAQKLALARTMWLDHKVEPSGLNTYQEFKYFTLMDIEPVKVKIFNELNLIDVYDFGSQVNQAGEPLALLQLYNGDNRQEACLKFALPYKDADEIVSSQGKRVTNRLQQLGSANSYIKRFLLMNCLSITQQIDEVDETIGMELKEEPKPKVVKKPLNEEEKKVVVNKVVGDSDDNADEMQLQALKKVAKKLNDIGEQEMAKKIQLKSENFTKMSRSNCEKCIEIANELIDKSEGGV